MWRRAIPILLAVWAFIVPWVGHGQGASALEINFWLGRGGVEELDGCYRVVQQTRVFYPWDEAVYVVAEIRVVGPRRMYKAYLEWYAPPDGTSLYRREIITGLKSGYYWCIWRKLPIRGTEVARMLGTWNVRVNVPGIGTRRISFSIREEAVPTSPSPPIGQGCLRPQEGASWPEILELARQAVVFIEGPTEEVDEEGNRIYVCGSGVIISPDGYVLTCAHVVEDIVGEISVLVGEELVYRAEVVKKHPQWDPESEGFTADIALLKIKGVSGLPCLPLGDSDAVTLEEEIRVLGYPRAEMGLGLIVGIGRVLGVRYEEGYSFLQVQVEPFDKGFSGGPVINARGEVIGLVMGVRVTELSQHQLAVAINTAKALLPAWFGAGFICVKGKIFNFYGVEVGEDCSSMCLRRKRLAEASRCFLSLPGSLDHP